MSTGIRMALTVNLLPLLFLAAIIVRSDQSTLPLRSFKIRENVTYDCIDIHKQPGLDHPLLKNHKIQMKPSGSNHELKNQTSYKTKIRCPYGTVPILRNTKEHNSNAQFFDNKSFHPFTADSLRTHIAGVGSRTGPYLGIEAFFSGHYVKVRKDEASYSQLYIGSALNNEVNFMQTGMMINPGLYGDDGVWSYGFWQGKDGKGCYNTACPGFVQVSRQIPIAQPQEMKPNETAWYKRIIHQDKATGNWWVSTLSPNVIIGYWPKELFNLMTNGGNMVGVGGVVQASPLGPSPPMGDGDFPNGDGSSIFSNINVLDSGFERRRIDTFPVETLLDSSKCYGLLVGQDRPQHDPRGYFFDYGGPGGDSCGI